MKIRKIIFVANSSQLYGAERCFLDLVLHLPDEISPIVFLPAEGPMARILKAEGIFYAVLPFRGWRGSRFFLIKPLARAILNIFALIRGLWIVRKINVDMVYNNTLYTPFGGLLSSFLRVPLVWHIHEFVNNPYDDRFDFGTFLSLRFVGNSTLVVVCNSKSLRDNLSEYISPSKIQVVYNGMLNAPSKPIVRFDFQMLSTNRVVLLIIGSITENKGQLDAIHALSDLVSKGVDTELIVVGSGRGEYVSFLKSVAVRLNIGHLIKWEGFKEDVSFYLKICDIVLVCSRFETFGRVVVEAMSFGCLVIASNTGGVPELIEDGVNGLLYTAGNIADLSNAIFRLIMDPTFCNEISKNAIKMAYSRFDKDRYVSDLVNIFIQT